MREALESALDFTIVPGSIIAILRQRLSASLEIVGREDNCGSIFVSISEIHTFHAEVRDPLLLLAHRESGVPVHVRAPERCESTLHPTRERSSLYISFFPETKGFQIFFDVGSRFFGAIP